MRESTLKVAVISCGMIANAAHIPAYRSLSDKVDLAAVCDVNPVSAEQTAQRFQIPRWYTDAEEMLLKEKPDLVSVCTPNALHKKNGHVGPVPRSPCGLRKAHRLHLCRREGDV